MSLSGKVALVTGGASGIGRATALAFAQRGTRVAIGDVDVHHGEETVHMIQQAKGEAVYIETDVRNPAEVASLVEGTVKAFGRLDCAFNNAGVDNLHYPVGELPEEEWDRVIDTNLKGVMLCLRYEIPRMLHIGKGAIVNASSVAGLIGSPASPAYISSKHGITGLTKSAALDYARKGIRVNAVCPGVIHTGIIDAYLKEHGNAKAQLESQSPMGRMGAPEEVANVVIWLCSDEASYVTGQALAIDGGWTAGAAPVSETAS